jgi:hypothetical protein
MMMSDTFKTGGYVSFVVLSDAGYLLIVQCDKP